MGCFAEYIGFLEVIGYNGAHGTKGYKVYIITHKQRYLICAHGPHMARTCGPHVGPGQAQIHGVALDAIKCMEQQQNIQVVCVYPSLLRAPFSQSESAADVFFL